MTETLANVEVRQFRSWGNVECRSFQWHRKANSITSSPLLKSYNGAIKTYDTRTPIFEFHRRPIDCYALLLMSRNCCSVPTSTVDTPCIAT
ncbi:hypothetical protein T4A_8546 [Trichinella pseudospiralis]|uniref:Uncharacterized protein n=1 Tax=Trichinella pseudospiralis TaxID=6337 RepID=A0A0V1EJK1_TRIPS|nr:hypothetical protein T4A_8546 [Trichinella pseudospiralis]